MRTILNEVILIGYISTEITFTGKDELMYCKFKIAVPRDYKNKEESRPADFIPCIAFGGSAERLYAGFIKGNKICVKGRLESSKYEKDGNTKYGLVLNVNRWYFIENRPRSLEEYAAEFSKGSEA